MPRQGAQVHLRAPGELAGCTSTSDRSRRIGRRIGASILVGALPVVKAFIGHLPSIPNKLKTCLIVSFPSLFICDALRLHQC